MLEQPEPAARLHESEIGVILISEQIDVRRFLLADLSSTPQTGVTTLFRLVAFRISIFEFRIFEKDLPWPH
jgi:hypothetical protein